MAFIGDRLEISAQHFARDAALKSTATDLTWGGLLDAVRQIEEFLASQTPSGARIALLLSEPVETLLAFFACARAGRVAMVMDLGWPEGRIQDLLAATEPALIFDDETLQSVLVEPILGAMDSLCPGLASPKEPDDFYAGFTSGSTGLPKGFVRSHRSWLRSFDLSEVDFQIVQPDQVIIAGGLSHSLHLYGAAHALHRGTTVTVISRFDPRSVLVALKASRGRAALYATPTQLMLIAEAARRAEFTVAAALVFSSGAKWPDKARRDFEEAFPSARLVEFYGASETSFISFSRTGDGTPPGSVGRPAENVCIAIGDPNDPAPSGSEGPLWVKSDLVFSQYICGSASETKWQNDWLTFGDHGYLDDDGFLFLTGRESRMVITSGMNVYPEEVEAALMVHPSVGAAVVVGLPDPLRGQRLEAFIELKSGLNASSQTLTQHCRTSVGASKTPKHFHICEKLPLTAGGKPDIQTLLEGLANGQSGKNAGPESEMP